MTKSAVSESRRSLRKQVGGRWIGVPKDLAAVAVDDVHVAVRQVQFGWIDKHIVRSVFSILDRARKRIGSPLDGFIERAEAHRVLMGKHQQRKNGSADELGDQHNGDGLSCDRSHGFQAPVVRRYPRPRSVSTHSHSEQERSFLRRLETWTSMTLEWCSQVKS